MKNTFYEVISRLDKVEEQSLSLRILKKKLPKLKIKEKKRL